MRWLATWFLQNATMKLVMDADLVCKIVVGGGHLDSVPCALHRLPAIWGPQWAVCVCGGSLGTAPSPRSGARHCVKGPSGRPLRKPILANGSLQEGASSCKILELPGSQVSWLNIFLLHVWPAWSIICFLYIIHIPQRPEMLGATRKDCCPLWWVGHIFKEARSWGLSLVCASLAP